MNRRVLATVCLGVLVALAGCSYDSTIGVRPVVDSVEAAPDDGYRLTVTVTVDTVDETAFSDVRVYGFSLDGDLLCSAAYGTVSANVSRTVECSGMPSVLVADTGDRNRTVESSGLASYSYTVEGASTIYLGRTEGGDHRYEFLEAVPSRRGPIAVRDDRPTMRAGDHVGLQCQQWRASRSGADFSALDDPDWAGWKYRDPETERFYRVTIENESYYDRTGEYGRVQVGDDPPVLAVDDLPRSVRRVVEDGDFTHDPRYASPDRAAFDSLIENATGEPVTSAADRSAALRTLGGTYGEFDSSRINCRGWPPTHGGNRVEHAAFLVDAGNATFAIELRTGQRLSGPAANRSASGR